MSGRERYGKIALFVEGVAQLAARLTVDEKVCGFEPRRPPALPERGATQHRLRPSLEEQPAPVTQVDRVSRFERESYRFKSGRGHRSTVQSTWNRHQHGAVGFYYGVFRPKPDALAAIYRRLEKRSHEVFPCRFRSAVAIKGGDVEGIPDGFYYLEVDKARRVSDWIVKAIR